MEAVIDNSSQTIAPAMETELLLDSILGEAEKSLRSLRLTAVKYKLAFIGTVFCGGLYGGLEIYGQTLKHIYSFTLFLYVFSMGMCALIIPFIFSPLYSFLPDKYLGEINNTLKRKVMFNYLNKYDCSMEIYPHASFPEGILSNIRILSGTFDFSFGDDLLMGRFRKHELQISEYHIRNIFMKKVFDGYVAKIQLANDHSINGFTILRDDFQKYCIAKNLNSDYPSNELSDLILKLFDENKNLIFIKVYENRIYLGIHGEKSMFEYSFKRITENKARYHADLLSFESLINTIDQFTMNV